MDVVATVEVPVSQELLFSYISELENYKAWLEIVHSVDRPDLTAAAWQVELRARLGPFARSKRLRMVRTEHSAPNQVVFERQELDGRRHSAWIMRANVVKTNDGSLLEMSLHYSGKLFTDSILQRYLSEQIDASRAELIRQLSAN